MTEFLECKYGCGAKFPDNTKGRIQYMNHCRFECPNKGKGKKKTKQTKPKMKTTVEKTHTVEKTPSSKISGSMDDEFLDERETLDRIISEVTNTIKRPAIVRMVTRHMGDDEESLSTLAEALRLADIPPHQRNLILKNWAAYKEIADIDDILKMEKSEEKKTSVKKKEEKKTMSETADSEIDKVLEDERRYLQMLRMRRERKMLEDEIQGGTKKEEDGDKQTMVVDGIPMKLTPQEMLAWKKYQADQKRAEEERRERRRIEEERRMQKEEKSDKDELVEFPVDGNKIIKVKESTIPILLMQQSQKDRKPSEELKSMREETKQLREQFYQFQTGVLQKEIQELKAQAGQDPLDRLFREKDRLEKLGIVSSNKKSAQDHMLAMDRAKLDTLLQIAVDKSRSTESKVNSLVDTFGPVAQQYVKEAITQMRHGRGETGEPVPRTEDQAKKTLSSLEEIDRSMEEPSSDEGSEQKVVSTGGEEHKPSSGE